MHVLDTVVAGEVDLGVVGVWEAIHGRVARLFDWSTDGSKILVWQDV
jgi:prephenate dehydratase